MQELFSPLTCGGTLLLAVPGGEKDTQYMARLCLTQRISCMVLVPSALEVLLQARANLLHVNDFLHVILLAVTIILLSLALKGILLACLTRRV